MTLSPDPRGEQIYDNKSMAIPWPYNRYSNGHWPMPGQWDWFCWNYYKSKVPELLMAVWATMQTAYLRKKPAQSNCRAEGWQKMESAPRSWILPEKKMYWLTTKNPKERFNYCWILISDSSFISLEIYRQFLFKIWFKGIHLFHIFLYIFLSFSVNHLLRAAEFIHASGDFCLPIQKIYIFVQD